MRLPSFRSLLDQRDLVLIVVIAVAELMATALDVSPILRVVLAVPMVLLLPGYVLVSAAFPQMVLPAVERLLLALGSSIALTILVGLLLAAAGVPLTPVAWAVALATLIVIGAVAAWFRRVQKGIVGPGFAFARVPRAGAVMLLVAGLIVADVLLGSRLIASQQVDPAPLQLWMVPVSASPDDAILGVRAGTPGGAYHLVISSSGNPIYQFDIDLAAGQTWERDVTFDPALRTHPIVARLYEGTSTAESRYVVLEPQTHGG